MDTAIHTLPTKPEQLYVNTDSLLSLLKDVYDISMSRVTLHRELKAGKLSSRKLGGRRIYAISDVRRWVEGGSMENEPTAP
ncbi:MAG: helix-turn-helix domain-containing protein [Chlorobiaceae bacterium]|nr:helix-turn-helix domain-containing protein [Chlorobiaceae bacterium]